MTYDGVADERQLALVARHSTCCPHSRACYNHQPPNSDATSCSAAGGMGCLEPTTIAAQHSAIGNLQLKQGYRRETRAI